MLAMKNYFWHGLGNSILIRVFRIEENLTPRSRCLSQRCSRRKSTVRVHFGNGINMSSRLEAGDGERRVGLG